jgi:tetratricopeptide (TPR) repeat protein
MLIPVQAGKIKKRVDSGSRSWFEDRTKQAGVAGPHTNRTFKNPYAEIMKGYTALGASVASSDYNRDGFEDLFVTDSKEDGLNRLYRNNGDFTFSEVAQEAGVAEGNDANNASANALWFDFNNNGYPDLLVVRFGHNLLFENQCDGTFRDVTARAGLGSQYMNCIAAIAFDYDLDGDLDLFLGSYFQPIDIFNPETPRFFPENFETANNGGGVNVYKNNGDGTFSDVTEQAGFDLSGWTLDLGHADMDHDGDDDLFVAADFGTDRLFINNGNGTFSDVTKTAIGFDTKKGMNVDWGDFDNDGLFDVYITNITDDYMREGNFLWRNNGDGTFSDVARETGTYSTGWGWAGKFFDYDNDGWLDLYVVNGWVSAGEENYIIDIFKLIIQPDLDMTDARIWPPMGNKTLSGYQKNVLFHNQGGDLFKNEASRHGLDSPLDARGVAVVDFDNDGRLDMFISNANAEPLLVRNVQPTGAHWIQFLLEGVRTNRDAVGARASIIVNGQKRLSYVNGGNGFASQSTHRIHFGLGDATEIERLEIEWPSGNKQEFALLEVDHIYRIVEGQDQLVPFVANVVRSNVEAKANDNFNAGMKAVASQDYQTALDSFEAALLEEPNNLGFGNEYRQVVITIEAHDRAIAFFEKLVEKYPKASNAWMNLGYACVDNIPIEGAITQVILANTAINHFSAAIDIEETWLGFFTRGNSYAYWPAIFGRTELAIADLEKAIAMAADESEQMPIHVRAWVALGDSYWRLDNLEKAREIWRNALKRFPAHNTLTERLSLDDEALNNYLTETYAPGLRVDTNLSEFFH